jgi:hypothetical protein
VNTHRHLQALQVARVGTTLWLQARHADVGAAFPVLPIVAARRLASPLGLGPLGWLYLDPRDIIALPGMAMAGMQVLPLPLPASARLVGLSLHAQVLFLPPNPGAWRVSGLVSERIVR